VRTLSGYEVSGQNEIDSSGNAYFAFAPSATADTEELERTPTALGSATQVTGPNLLFACVDDAGDEVWVEEWARTTPDGDVFGMALSLDESLLYVALTNRSLSTAVTVTVDGTPIVMPLRSTVLIALSTVDGSLVWTKQPTGNDIQARQIDVQRDSGDILIACSAQSAGADLDFDEVVITAGDWSAGAETTPFVWVLTEDGASATTTHIVRVLEVDTGSADHAIGIGGY